MIPPDQDARKAAPSAAAYRAPSPAGGVQDPTLIIAAALWDKQDTSSGVVEAGYLAVVDALTQSVADSMEELFEAEVIDPGYVSTIIGRIESVVQNAVHRAIKSKLDWEEELFDTLDSLIGPAFQAFFPVTTSGAIQLTFNSHPDRSYSVGGELVVVISDVPVHRPVPAPPPVPPIASDRTQLTSDITLYKSLYKYRDDKEDRMDLYDFAVTSFTIHHTRSLINDTLVLSHTAHVDRNAVASSLVHLGDHDNGTYSVLDLVHGTGAGLNHVVINDPSSEVAFIFQLLNAGNVPDGALTGRVAATSDQLAGITAGLSGAGAADAADALSSYFLWAGVALEVFANLYSWLDVDCDGAVAIDQSSGPRYVLDAWTDNGTGQFIVNRRYPGTDSPDGCGGNSDYEVTWLVRHYRGWMPAWNATGGNLRSVTGVGAATHRGGVHVFGLVADGSVTHARTFTGAAWLVDEVGQFTLATLPVSAISFNDRLYLFGVQSDGTVSSLAYTEDGGSWIISHASSPAGVTTNQPIATVAFGNRLSVFAYDGAGHLQAASTADLEVWAGWAAVPPVGMVPSSGVAAAALGGTLHLFGLFPDPKAPQTSFVVHNSSMDGSTWSGWSLVERGGHPVEAPSDTPLDVAATASTDRVYLVTRWRTASPGGQTSAYIAVNFSGDGENWSGWREPEATPPPEPSNSPAITFLGDHVYVASPTVDAVGDNTQVLVH
jgi:hypothetical protein